MTYVAGYGHPTPFRLELEGGGRFRIGRITSGDGRVATRLGQLDGVETYFSPAVHGGLPSAPDVLRAIDDLLVTGTTTELIDTEPVRRGDAGGAPVMVPAEEFDVVPFASVSRGTATADAGGRDAEALLNDGLRLTIGGGRAAPPRPAVEVRVLNASLEQAKFPVAVGHYARLPQEGAERFLDGKLDGALRARQRLGQYPEDGGIAIYVGAPRGNRPRGAIVLGLGELGTLTPATLAAAMTQGAVAYVLDEWRHAGADEQPRTFGVSAVLVGTPGRRGLPIEHCVAALTEGVIRGVERLNQVGGGTTIELMHLELVERFDQAAEEAALATTRLIDMLPPDVTHAVDLIVEPVVEEGDGRLRGSPPRRMSGVSWVRVNACLEPYDGPTPPPLRRMTFSAQARGAQADLIDHYLDLAKIRAYIDVAVVQAGHDTSVSRTLYEQVFPHRAKLDLDHTESLHLIVDKEMAQIPWELLSAATLDTEAVPLALRAGMLRQLQSRELTRERAKRPTGRIAFVVGDPPTALPRLPGAREEAVQVADLFDTSGWEVERLIYDAGHQPGRNWMRILDTLNARPYRVVHIAAHGVFDDGAEGQRSGVVIGPEPHHRITALDFEQMTVTPDLVFLNCCHLGRLGWFLDEAPPETRRQYEQPHRVAATVARQLLQNGVGAVVVAGWAVDDFAANAFARRLYVELLDGVPFGEAALAARHSATTADGGRTTTWGAFQCYGDPDFELSAESRPPAERPVVLSATQLAREFDVQATHAGNALSAGEAAAIGVQIDRLRDAGIAFLDDGRVLEALARALGELGAYEEAVSAYEEALQDASGRVHLKAAEQLANLRVRVAVRRHRLDPEASADAEALFAGALSLLDHLDKLAGPTAERHALRGSLHKKRATTRTGRARHEDIAAAQGQYGLAYRRSGKGYHLNLWIQTTALAGRDPMLDDDTEARLREHYRVIVERDERRPSPDYWEAAGIADTLVSFAVARLRLEGVEDPLQRARAGYEAAFRLRSTVRQRDSAIEHLEDLSALVPTDHRARYLAVVDALRRNDGTGE